MKKLIAGLLLLLTCLSSSANEVDKYEAYILINKDTVFGHVLTNDLETVHLKVDFEAPDGKVTSYTPGKLKKFGINVLDIWRKYVLLDLGVPTGPKDTGTTLVFAWAVEDEGKVKLYKYECYQYGRNKTIHMNLEVPGDRILIGEHCLIKEDGEMVKIARTSIIGDAKKLLRAFFADCPTVITSVNNSKKIYESLQPLVRQYNHCDEKKPSRRP